MPTNTLDLCGPMLKIIHDKFSTDSLTSNQQMTLSISLLDEHERPFILVFPGGGYHHLAEKEGYPVVKWLHSIGYHAGVLYYPIGTIDHLSMVKELEEVFIQLRKHAKKWHITENKIGALGFSAGGHLAGLASTKITNRANALLLCYPVITFTEPFRHAGSREHFLGNPKPSKHLVESYSIEHLINEHTPPTFIWHTADDQSVPIQNTILLANSLARHNIPFEYHVFPSGKHGLGLAKEFPYVERWLSFAEIWLKNIFDQQKLFK